MSNPFIQFELDAAKKAPTLASALRISLSTAMGGLVRMWLHIYGADKAMTVSAFYLRSFFEVDDAARVGEALVELKFAEQIDSATWRVKGAGRYTRLAETRREAGRKGAAVTNSRSANAAAKLASESASAAANDHDDAANGRQTVGKAGSGSASAAANGRQTADSGGKRSANDRQNPEKGRQKTALDPRSEISPPTGERDISDGRSSSRAEAGPPPSGAGTAAQGEEGAKPEKPPRPKLVEGTPEYREAVAMGDYEALQWGPYAPKAVKS